MTTRATLPDQFKRALKSALRQVVGALIGIAVVSYFVYYAVQGDRGLIAKHRLENEIAQANLLLADVRGEREHMERRAHLLHAESLDRDMLDERARAMLNLSNNTDVIVPLPPVYDGDARRGEKALGTGR